MKKIISTILCTLLLIISAISVSATSETYIIDEFGISVNPPTGYYVLTEDIDENDPALSNFGYTKEELLELFEEEDICFITYSAFYTDEMTLYVYEVEEEDLSYYTDEELEDIINSDTEHIESLGATVTNSDIYNNDDMTYLVYEYNYGEGDYCTDYFTVKNNLVLNLICWSYGSETTTNQKQHYLSMVNSISFNKDSDNIDSPFDPTVGYDIPDDISDLVSEEDVATIGISIIISIISFVLTLIAGAVVAIILITKAKKRRRLAALQAAETTPSESTKYCIGCGVMINADDAFCTNCGANQNPTQTSEETQ